MVTTVKSAFFLKSSSSLEQCPVTDLKEVAFLGRSNVGKSSLINFLMNSKNLAKVSQTPGKTRLLNYFLVNDAWHLVDLPGYGWAKINKKEQGRLVDMVQSYLKNRTHLSLLLLLIDSNIAPQQIDVITLELLISLKLPVSVVFTKVDRLSRLKVNCNVRDFFAQFAHLVFDKNRVFTVSAKGNLGKDELLTHIIKNVKK